MGPVVDGQAPPNPEQPAADVRPGILAGIPLWAAVLLAIAALVFAAIVIAQVASPLAGLLSPADPPVFAPATLIEHRNMGNGVDEWIYATEASGCQVYEWYQERADLCRPSPLLNCQTDETDPGQVGQYHIGYCQGSEPFGGFASDWEIYIADGYNEDGMRTRFNLAREVDWINQD